MDKTDIQFSEDFENIEFLAGGGFGKVYKARKRLDGQLYAVKQIKLPGGEENKKVLREVAAISGFDHKNIVRYFHSWIRTGSLSDSESSSPCTTNSESMDNLSNNGKTESWTGSSDVFRENSVKMKCNEMDNNPNHGQSESCTDSSVVFQKDSILLTSDGKEIKSDEMEQTNPVEYLYIQQELCQRGTLKNWLYPDTEIIERDMNVVRSLFSQIVEAVEYVHSKMIIHRDLKPSNIFLADSSESLGSGCPRVKLGDFGLISNAYANLELKKQSSLKQDDVESSSLAVLKTTDISKLTEHVGTALYMSPELFNGAGCYDFKVDIYSLGLILFELLAQFSTESEKIENFTNIRDNAKFPNNFEKRFPYEQGVILTMISMDPNERPDISIVYNSFKRRYLSEDTTNSISRKYSNDNENESDWFEILRTKPFILERGEVNLQNKEVRLKDILPKNNDQANYILSRINSIARDELMVRGKPVIFASCNIPELSSQGIHYIKRQLYSCREVSPKILREELCTDIFIVTRIKLEKLKTMVKYDETVHEIKSIQSIKSMSGRIFLLENSYQTDMPTFYRTRTGNQSIHLLYFINDTFSWVWTCGSVSIIKKYLISKSFLATGEIELVQKTVKRKQKEPVFIVGESGMGKSLLLTSLANKINCMIGNSFIIFHKMNDFIARLAKQFSGAEFCTKQGIMSMFSEMHDNFEEHLLRYWMTQPMSKVTVHLMLDGLDKLGGNERNLVFRAFNIIIHDFPGVQLWVTLPEELQDEVEEYFTTLCYRIQGFSHSEQVVYLQKTWGTKLKIESNSLERLEKLALNCVRATGTMNDKEATFASNPWHCHMLSEIYESKISAMLSNEKVKYFKHIAVSRLYQETTEKMLERYLKSKGVQILDEDFVHIFRENMELRHIYFGIKFLFPLSSCSLLPVFNITSETIDQMRSTIKEQGIIANLDPIFFKRKTYAEYFIAVFIHKALTNRIPGIYGNHLVKFKNFFCEEVLDVIRHQSFHNPDAWINKCSKFRHPNLCNFLNEMLQIGNANRDLLDDLLPGIYDFACDVKTFDSTKSVILASIQHNYINLAQYILKSRNPPDIDRFLEKAIDDHIFLVEVSVRFTSVSFVRFICNIIENWHRKRGNIFRIPEDLFIYALYKGNYEMVKFLVEEKGFRKETWNKIRINDKNKFGVIHHIIRSVRGNKRSVIKQKQKLISYLVKLDRSLLLEEDVLLRIPLLLPHDLNHYELYTLKIFLVTQFGTDAGSDEISAFHNNLMHWSCYSEIKNSISPQEYHKYLENLFVENRFKLINFVGVCGDTMLHCAIKTYHDSLQEITLNLFKKLDADFNISDSSGSTVLHICIQKNCKLKFIKLLIKHGSNIETKNAEGYCARSLAVQCGNLPLIKLLDEICQPKLNLKLEC